VQYIGMGPALQVNLLPIPGVRERGAFLLSSDGAHYLGVEIMAKLCAQAPDPRVFVRRFLDTAEWLGGTDNASAICVSASFRSPRSADPGHRKVLQVWDAFGLVELWLDEVHESRYSTPGTPRIEEDPPRRRSLPIEKGAKPKKKNPDQRSPEVVLDFSAQVKLDDTRRLGSTGRLKSAEPEQPYSETSAANEPEGPLPDG
jgi:hypothetical protein